MSASHPRQPAQAPHEWTLLAFVSSYNIFSISIASSEHGESQRPLIFADDPKSAEPLPPRGGSGRLDLDLDASSNGGLRRRAARRAPAHHPAVAEEAGAHGAEKVRGEDSGADDERGQQRPGVCGTRVLEALLLLPQGPGRHHGRLRVQRRASLLQRRMPVPPHSQRGAAGDGDASQEAPRCVPQTPRSGAQDAGIKSAHHTAANRCTIK